ncbi:hypothetical protein RDI58_026905 [Solanum bulbocastanum]|uniref:Uncharacterized protein n=1 Tax=Solanum bulbocastanum TaxID=147425 RepID=A0AAN8SUZ7_SOLBU
MDGSRLCSSNLNGLILLEIECIRSIVGILIVLILIDLYMLVNIKNMSLTPKHMKHK